MGILSLVKASVSKLIPKALGKVASKSNPVSTFVAEIPSVQGAGSGALPTKNLIGAIKSGTLKGVSKLTTTLVANPAKTLIGAVVGIPVVAGILSNKSARGNLAQIPSQSFEAGSNIGEVIGGEKPIKELTSKDIIKTGAIVGTGAAVVGAGVLAIDKFLDKNKEDSVLGTDDNIPKETGGAVPNVPSVSVGASSPIASTPQGILTENITASKSKKSRRRAVKMPPNPIVRVNNKVIVNNKNYLKNGNR